VPDPLPTATKRPKPMTGPEKLWAGALVVVGAVLLVGIVVWFLLSTGGELVTKSSVTTTTSGQTATETTEYADSVLLGGIGVAAGLLLAGAFYARIREIKLPGGVSASMFGDEPEAVPAKTEEAIASAISATPAGLDEGTRGAAARTARSIAADQLRQDFPGGPAAAPSSYLTDLGTTAVREALERMGLR
jgi:hypothetical protein